MGVCVWLLKWFVVLSEFRGLGVFGVIRMRSRFRFSKRLNVLVWFFSFCRCFEEYGEFISSWFSRVSGGGIEMFSLLGSFF